MSGEGSTHSTKTFQKHLITSKCTNSTNLEGHRERYLLLFGQINFRLLKLVRVRNTTNRIDIYRHACANVYTHNRICTYVSMYVYLFVVFITCTEFISKMRVKCTAAHAQLLFAPLRLGI